MMAFGIDVPEPWIAEDIADSPETTQGPLKPRFEPMRRKLHVVVDV